MDFHKIYYMEFMRENHICIVETMSAACLEINFSPAVYYVGTTLCLLNWLISSDFVGIAHHFSSACLLMRMLGY